MKFKIIATIITVAIVLALAYAKKDETTQSVSPTPEFQQTSNSQFQFNIPNNQ